MNPEIQKRIGPALVLIGVIIALILLRWLVGRWYRKRLLPIAQALGGRVHSSLSKGNFCILRFKNLTGLVQLFQMNKYSAQRLELSLLNPLGFEMNIRQANFAIKRLSKVGLVGNVKSGDPVFDEKFLVKTSNEIPTQNFILDDSKRRALEWLLANGYHEFSSRQDRITAIVYGFKDKNMDPVLIRESFSKMLALLGKP